MSDRGQNLDDPQVIERDLTRTFDNYLREPQEDHVEAALDASVPASQVDISRVLEAVELTASSIKSMSERIRELEAHCEEFTASNEELEASNGQLVSQLDEMSRHRGELDANLTAENQRAEQLETITAEHISRAATLEHDLGELQADLKRVVEVVGSMLGTRERAISEPRDLPAHP